MLQHRHLPGQRAAGQALAAEANKGLSMVGDYTRRMVELAEGRKMVFMVLQAGWSGVNPEHNPKNKLMFPTFREDRYMMYQAIICGANSLSFFGMPVGLTGRDAELGWNWGYWRAVLKPLLAEIKPGSELYRVLIPPDSRCPLQFTGQPARIEVRARKRASTSTSWPPHAKDKRRRAFLRPRTTARSPCSRETHASGERRGVHGPLCAARCARLPCITRPAADLGACRGAIAFQRCFSGANRPANPRPICLPAPR